MRSRDIRRSFLEYFQREGHTIVSSSSLVPGDDPTLLFTNAGMNQFKDAFLGREKRRYTRATTSQKCMRVSGKHNDLDNVGPSLRHHTFFEMLGNFSFGDYFKREAIPFAWEMLTKEWSLPPDRLFPTIFKGDAGIPRDDEAHAIWTKLVPPERISELGLAENFWQMGETGPCGRCSEIHYYRGPDIPCEQERAGNTCLGIDCSCDRYVEIWNNVFMEFDRQSDATLNPLPAPSIDTGMGLERITAVIQGKISNYDTDLFTPILAAIGERAGRQYRATLDDPSDISMRVIADHLRAMTFLISDGVMPSNEWRGYVLRKIMRRAMRHGKKLGFTEPVLHTLVPVLVREMGEAYPQLGSDQQNIVRMVRSEEERFDAVLTAGLPRLEDALDRAEAGSRVMSGDEAFRLYDSLGVPLDFMEDVAGQRQLAIDREGFDRAMQGQRERARAASSFKGGEKGFAVTVPAEVEPRFTAAADEFTGYESTTLQGLRRGRQVGDRPARRPRRFYRPAADSLLPRSGRPGVRSGPDLRRRRIRGRGSAHGALRGWQAAPPPGPCHAWVVQARADRERRSPGRSSRFDQAESHRHASAPRGAAASAREPRQAGGIPRCAGSAALRLRALHPNHPTAGARDRTHRQRADPPERSGADRGEIDRGSDCRRGDGPLRREVRGSRPRRIGARLQPGIVWRNPRQGHRRHRLLRDHR
jgi:alanyl-tRNA synthetase